MIWFEAIQSTSNYKEISWDEKRQLWKAEFSFNGKISKSYFENELDAVKRINQLCKNIGIPSKNPELPEIPNQQVTPLFLNQSLLMKILTFSSTRINKDIHISFLALKNLIKR